MAEFGQGSNDQGAGGHEFPWWSSPGFAAIAAVGASALINSGKAVHAEEEALGEVSEVETGIKFPMMMNTPPFIRTRWKGSRPGFVFKNGGRGIGYYMDRYRGKDEGYTDLPDEGIDQYLVGVGMRCMLQRCDIHLARAYAIGLYMDHSFVKGLSPAELTDPTLRKTLLLVMAREVKGGHIGKGFDRTLIPKIREKMGKKQGPAKEALRQFTAAFNRCGILKVGAEVLMVFGGDNTLTIYIEKVPAVRIESAMLCEAVMEMYVGSKPVGPMIKSNMLQGYDEAFKDGLGNVPVPAGTKIE